MPSEHNIPSVHAPFCGVCRVWCDVSGAGKNLDQTQTSHRAGKEYHQAAASGDKTKSNTEIHLSQKQTLSPDTKPQAL